MLLSLYNFYTTFVLTMYMYYVKGREPEWSNPQIDHKLPFSNLRILLNVFRNYLNFKNLPFLVVLIRYDVGLAHSEVLSPSYVAESCCTYPQKLSCTTYAEALQL